MKKRRNLDRKWLMITLTLAFFISVSLISSSLSATAQTTGAITGTIIFRDASSNYGISTIPLSLPKAGCMVRITVCDYGNKPPTKLIIGADPVPNNDKAPSLGPLDYAARPSPYDYYYFDAPNICGAKYKVIEGVDIMIACNQAHDFGSNDNYYEYYPYICDVNNGEECVYNPVNGCPFDSYDSESAWPIQDKPGICCDLDGPDNIPGTADDNVISNGHCCPKSHPIYDPTSGNCVREATVETRKMGYCSVLTTTLETAFTDITFADSQGRPLSTADYVAVSYVC